MVRRSKHNRYTARELVVAAAREGIKIDMEYARKVIRAYYNLGTGRSRTPSPMQMFSDGCRAGKSAWIIR